MNPRTHIVVQPTSNGLSMLSDAQPENMARNFAKSFPGSLVLTVEQYDKLAEQIRARDRVIDALRPLPLDYNSCGDYSKAVEKWGALLKQNGIDTP